MKAAYLSLIFKFFYSSVVTPTINRLIKHPEPANQIANSDVKQALPPDTVVIIGKHQIVQ